MSLPSLGQAPLRSRIWHLLLVAASFSIAIAYLGVPVCNAVLFGPVIALQAATGSVLLVRLTRTTGVTLLILMGPGIVIGGAIAFATFQLVGRGMVGVVCVLLEGVFAVWILLRWTPWPSVVNKLSLTSLRIFGLAAFAMAWEFPELGLVAVAIFFVGMCSEYGRLSPNWVFWTSYLLSILALVSVFLIRQPYWWIVTDDYKFFEVISTHLTNSGPFSKWGSISFAKYHWLSYGWSGLLNILGGQPSTFLTLTLVMPLVYSTSLAASLLLIISTLSRGGKLTRLGTLPAWTIVAITRLDWSGTSTAGVYAVLAGFFALNTMNQVDFKKSSARFVVYAIFAAMAGLTKFPSTFALLVTIAIGEINIQKFRLKTIQRFISPFLTLIAGLLTMFLIWAGSHIVSGYNLESLNPELGDLSAYGPKLALIFTVLRRSWLVLLLLIVGLGPMKPKSEVPISRGFRITWSFAPVVTLGFVLDVTIVGNANTFEYFSGPMYFVSTMPLILLKDSDTEAASILATKWWRLALVASISVAGWSWNHFKLVDRAWSLSKTAIDLPLSASLVNDVLGNSFVGASFATAIFMIYRTRSSRHTMSEIGTSLIISILILSSFTLIQSGISKLSEPRTNEAISATVGTQDERQVGTWLRHSTEESDLLATNGLVDSETNMPNSNFALAAWSQREFLVLGPKFLGDVRATQDEIALCESFGSMPSMEGAIKLRDLGVSWFILNKADSLGLKLDSQWKIRFENSSFIVLQL